MRFLLTVLASLALVSTVHGQDTGFVAFQAPEAGGGICVGNEPEKTIACARDKCVKESGLEPQDCIASAWCYPMGWVGDIFMQHKEGNHWHEFVCGQVDEAALQAAVASKCKNDWLIECSLVQKWSPDGKEVAVE